MPYCPDHECAIAFPPVGRVDSASKFLSNLPSGHRSRSAEGWTSRAGQHDGDCKDKEEDRASANGGSIDTEDQLMGSDVS
jgi:hypothetical protein